MPSFKPALVLIGTAAVLGSFAVIGLSGRQTAEAKVAAPEPAAKAPAAPLALVMVQPTAAATEASLTLPGTLRAWQATAVHPRADGYLRRYLADMGDVVKQGQLLAEIETPELDQDVLSARARLAQAKAQLDLAKITTERYQQLVGKGAVPKLEADTKATAYLAAQADVSLAQAQLQRLVSQTGYNAVRAPFAGRITQRLAEPGQLVNAESALFQLAQTERLRVTVQVPQTSAGAIAVGQKAEVLLREAPGQVFAGSISRSAGALDAARTLATEIVLDNAQGQLLPGASVDVRLALPSSGTAVLVPNSALIVNGKGSFVAVAENGVAKLRPVQLGRDLGKQTEVLGGLGKEAGVLLGPPDTIADGAAIKVLPPPVEKH